jgi:hypothetical protein
MIRILLAIAAAMSFVGCSGSHAPQPAPRTSPTQLSAVEPWLLREVFPQFRELYTRTDARRKMTMRGYSPDGAAVDPLLGPLLTTDVGPDRDSAQSLRSIYDQRVARRDPRPGSSQRILHEDNDMIIWESRYAGPPDQPSLRFVSIMRMSRHADQGTIAMVSYIGDESKVDAAGIERWMQKLRQLRLK